MFYGLRDESPGLAAMSAFEDLMKLLISNGVLSKEDAIHVLKRSIDSNLAANTPASKDAAKILHSIAEGLRDCCSTSEDRHSKDISS